MIDIIDILSFQADPHNQRACLEAAQKIGADEPEWANRVAQSILGAILEHRVAANVPTPGGKEILEALDAAAKGAELLAASVCTILAARVTVPAIGEEQKQMRRDLAPLVVGTISETLGIPVREFGDDQLDWPLAPHFENLGQQLKRIRGALTTSDVRLPTRFIDSREIRLVDRLSSIFHDVAGKRASAWGGGKTEYRQPFAAFVDLVWPLTGQGAAPSNDALEGRLKLISGQLER